MQYERIDVKYYIHSEKTKCFLKRPLFHGIARKWAVVDNPYADNANR